MSTPCPTIHVYGSAGAPDGYRWSAFFFLPTVPTEAQEARGVMPSEAPLPNIFFGPTREAVRAAAEAWWIAEQQKVANRKAGFAARKAAKAAPAERTAA